MSINDEHDKAVRATRRKVATAVQERAAAEMKKASGWKKLVWAIVLGAAAVAGWYLEGGTSQIQPAQSEPPAHVTPAEPADPTDAR